MFLKGKTISLRALEPSDADTLYQWENDLSLWEVSFTQVPFSRFTLEEFVNSSHQDIYTNKQLRLMITLPGDGRSIGTVDLFEFDPQHARAGLGIFIQDEFRKKGSAIECIELMKEYAFSILHLKQLFVHINESNAPSLALFEKAGFEKSGLKKNWSRTGIGNFEHVWFMQCFNTKM